MRKSRHGNPKSPRRLGERRRRSDPCSSDIVPLHPLTSGTTACAAVIVTDGSTKILAGQKALVTGANSGIGEAVAIALGQAGAEIVVNYVTGEDRAEAVAEEIRRSDVRAFAYKADISEERQVQEMFRRAIAEFGTIDILVNNAGLQRDAPFHTMSLEQWNTVIAVNLTGQFLCAREAVLDSCAAASSRPSRALPARSSVSARCMRSSRGPGTPIIAPQKAASR